MKKLIYFLFILLISQQSFAQYSPQKYELRGVWIASLGIDWPGVRGTTASDIASQKTELSQILDKHKSYGMNAMFFHVRPKCDAVYNSSIEPWSRYLTGQDGLAPSDPNYDPLQYAIQESHKRGMELHAWLNPYRANATGDDPSSASSMHVINKHPEWIIKCSGTQYRFLDPALPEVRAYLIKVIMDIVRRYDVDGIHFDDYFYPYSDYGSFNDDASWNKYKGTFTDRTKWRNNNVNLLVSMINDSIKAVKPWVKFGISPSGNTSVNAGIYVDAPGWLQGNYTDTLGVAHTGKPSIDYIMPQLYWVEYSGYQGSWAGASTLNGRHLYMGLPAYRYADNGWTPNELGWEMKMNRAIPTCKGGVYFSSKSLTNQNAAGCTDSLMHNYYVNPAVTPKMEWTAGSNKKPNAPANFRLEKNSSTGKYEFKWDRPAAASDGDTASVYVVYRFNTAPSASDLNNAAALIGYTGQTTLPASDARFSAASGNYYVVTAFDRYSNESSMSNVYQLNINDQMPSAPVLTSPASGNQAQASTVAMKWAADPLAQSYVLQVATDPDFKNVILNYLELKQTTVFMFNIQAEPTYYWRVKAVGISGSSSFSQPFSFASGLAVAPTVPYPAHQATNVFLDETLRWNKLPKATSYRVQVSTVATMTSNIIFDAIVTDTLYKLTGLGANKLHFWHVKSINSFGESNYGQTWGFKTGAATDVKEEAAATVKEYSLAQNYPNPFNPVTRIKYTLAGDGYVKLSVYSILGKEIAVLVDKYQSAGTHYAEFDASKADANITSGIYFYTIKSGAYVNTRKMTILK